MSLEGPWIPTRNARPTGGTNPKNAYANAVAGGGGILLGAQGAVALSSTTGSVSASLGNNVSLPDGDVTVSSASDSQTQSDATGVGVGFIGIGVAVADASSNVTTSTSVGTGLDTESTRTGDLTVGSHGINATVAASTAGSGGVVAGNGSIADADDDSSSSTTIGATAHTLYANDVTISSQNEAQYYIHSDSTNAAVVGASGAFASFDGDTSAATTLPSGFTIAATGIVLITSENDFFRSPAAASASRRTTSRPRAVAASLRRPRRAAPTSPATRRSRSATT